MTTTIRAIIATLAATILIAAPASATRPVTPPDLDGWHVTGSYAAGFTATKDDQTMTFVPWQTRIGACRTFPPKSTMRGACRWSAHETYRALRAARNAQ